MSVTIIKFKMFNGQLISVHTILGATFTAVTSVYSMTIDHGAVLEMEQVFTSEKLAIEAFDAITGEYNA